MRRKPEIWFAILLGVNEIDKRDLIAIDLIPLTKK